LIGCAILSKIVKIVSEGVGAVTPVWMFEGNKKLDPVSERNLAERRFSSLAAAVRQHEASTRRQLPGVRAADSALYRRLRQICGDPSEAEPAA
jgi:hypothetical protein